MGLPTSPPYLSLRNKNNKASLFMKGVSFASAGAGILNSTMLYGPQLGQLISLTKQVDQYEIVHQELVKELGSSAAQEQEQYFSKSIFNLVIGTTDFANYDLLPDLQIKYTKEQYASLMSSSLKRQLKVTKNLSPVYHQFLVNDRG
ncbi:hypothetical protein LWI28_013223 [Acer negundo]|uniref:Uncharacterized protein n=1 Tax=Acer negundo TaxID=4023 RepID=A0AAD5J626_ACENE|nr:hypothetical protein LWI28_013223 [Acer negundo]